MRKKRVLQLKHGALVVAEAQVLRPEDSHRVHCGSGGPRRGSEGFGLCETSRSNTKNNTHRYFDHVDQNALLSNIYIYIYIIHNIYTQYFVVI